ncbi:MAG: 4-hydroxy-tetrahydrodipicolinate reductase [SAR202 cluster bacterium]|nr:4-hydroxy-tetrahydrodipicolinate reductase [SAR202 cluster bacterium]
MAAIRVVVHGVLGKMGQEVLRAVTKAPDMEAVGAADRTAKTNLLSIPGDSRTIPLSSDLGAVLEETKPDVVVDFTNAEGCKSAASESIKRGVRFVSGSTGLSEAEISRIESMAAERKVGVVLASNFALGAVVLMDLVRKAAPYFDYIDIIESHHEQKIDSPSGTSLSIARAATQSKKAFKRNRPEKQTLAGTMGGEQGGVGIHSLRQPGRSAHHEVVMGIQGQTLTLRHDVLGRDCYMPGVLAAVREVVNRKGLVVGLDKILGLQ